MPFSVSFQNVDFRTRRRLMREARNLEQDENSDALCSVHEPGLYPRQQQDDRRAFESSAVRRGMRT